MDNERQYCQGYLGYRAKDRVTGFEGTITSMSFDLFGCVQCALTPDVTRDEKTGKQEHHNGHWYDTNRLELLTTERVIPLPEFPFFAPVRLTATEPKQRKEYTGAADKPAPSK